LASVFAVSDLVKEGLLDVNVIFLVEGEEESGSIGFASAAEKHKVSLVYTFDSLHWSMHLRLSSGTLSKH
jgi:acetylornithine deacetylase/succinyl-diaminopimelate desuccinylase-like protein